MQSESAFLLTKLNATLISIVKFEWRSSWQNFIPDICSSARESFSKCENALNILKLLSEEIFDFSKGNLLQSEAVQLKTQMNTEFTQVFELCNFVLNEAVTTNGVPPTLIKACLRTL